MQLDAFESQLTNLLDLTCQILTMNVDDTETCQFR